MTMTTYDIIHADKHKLSWETDDTGPKVLWEVIKDLQNEICALNEALDRESRLRLSADEYINQWIDKITRKYGIASND
jgi:hypothetical protein